MKNLSNKILFSIGLAISNILLFTGCTTIPDNDSSASLDEISYMEAQNNNEVEKTNENNDDSSNINDNLELFLQTAYSQLGTPDEETIKYQEWIWDNGGEAPEIGPCASFISWCFTESGLQDLFLDGEVTGYPHIIYDYYDNLGLVDMNAKIGDIAFVNDAEWAKDLSASHSSIVVDIDEENNTYTALELVVGGVQLREHSFNEPTLVGFAHIPY